MDLRVLEAAHGQPMDRAGVQSQTVISSTHQHPDGTMTAVLQRAAARDWARLRVVLSRVEPFYTEHRFCRVDDVFGSGHPPTPSSPWRSRTTPSVKPAPPAITGSL